MALFLKEQGNLEAAAPLYGEDLNSRRRILGDDHPDTLRSINNMAVFLDSQGNLEEAEQLYREVVDRSRRTLPEDHPHRLTYQRNWDVFQLNREALRQERVLLN